MKSKKILTLEEELTRMNFVAKKIGVSNFLNESKWIRDDDEPEHDECDHCNGDDDDCEYCGKEARERAEEEAAENRMDDLDEAYGDKVLGRGYTHFLIGKDDQKIFDGWDYKDLDNDEIKHWVKIDMNDNDFYGKTKNDFKLVTAQYLIKNGINSKDTNNWDKTRYNEPAADENPVDGSQALNELSPELMDRATVMAHSQGRYTQGDNMATLRGDISKKAQELQ